MAAEPIYVTRPTMAPLSDFVAELEDIWKAQFLTNSGPKHQELARRLTEYLGVDHIGLYANGHLALESALQALAIRGEVITTPFTFASTTHAIVRSGAEPVFCDIDPTTYVMDPELIEDLITDRTTAILPVHVYGNLCDSDAIGDIARRHGLKVIYDAAHAFGVTRNGVGAGTLGDVSMFSFHATKVFNTIEGGGLTFADPALSQPLQSWRQFGQIGSDNAGSVGTNAKMTEPAAAMGICNLRYVDENITKRRLVCERYREHLDGIPGIVLNPAQQGVRQNYSYFPVLFDPARFGRSRDEVADTLALNDIYARRYFHPLTSRFTAYGDRFATSSTPRAEQTAERVLTLPLYPDLALEDVDRICEIILRTR
jgi:dTDP-4-amino-4,6-dideoxygalactose transaminase